MLAQDNLSKYRTMSKDFLNKTFSEIAEAERVSTRGVQEVANLSLLAPDILDGIAAGKQSVGDCQIKH